GKAAARAVLVAAEDEMTALGLRLNPKTAYFPAERGVDFCGYRTWTTHVLPRKRNIKKARATFRAMAKDYAQGKIDLAHVQPRVASFLAYTKHCAAQQTAARILDEFILQRSNHANHH